MKITFNKIVIEFWLIVSLIIFMFCIMNFQEANKINEYNLSATYENKPYGDFILTDTYDSEDSTIYDFFKSDNALEIMNATYESLYDSEINYYEIARQSFDYMGYLDFDVKFTDGEDYEQLNQIDSFGNRFTPLKAMQINQIVANKWKIADKMEEIDVYTYISNKIPIALGYNYKSYFDCGDEFQVKYLGDKQYDCVVIGFIKKGAYVQLDGEKESVNNSV